MGLRTYVRSLGFYLRHNKRISQIINNKSDTYIELINWWHSQIEWEWLYHFIEHHHLNPQRKEILLFSVFGKKWRTKVWTHKIKLFFSGENINQGGFDNYIQYADYCLEHMQLSMGFDKLDHPRYYHFPLWIRYCFEPTATYQDVVDFVERINNINHRQAYVEATHSFTYKNQNNSKFAVLMARHDNLSNIRAPIVHLLNTVSSVSCAGPYLNNTDELKVKFNDDKLLYLKQFRYNICPENSNHRYYTTEKIFDAIRAGCIPIYWGSEGCPEPEILNQEAILFYDPDNPDALLQQVRRLESDPEYYAEFILRPPFKEDAADKIWQMIDGLRDKLDKVINQH